MAWTTDWRVTIDGTDVSTRMRPYLLDITVQDRDGTSSDTCSLRFDDTGGQLLLPKPGAAVVVYLQGAQVFEGYVDSTPWEMTRGGGRMLSVTAKGYAKRGDGASAVGSAMPTTLASIPGNVISVSIDPSKGKRRYAKSTVRYFDRAAATYKSEDVEIGLDDVSVTNHSRELATNADEAKRFGEGRKSDAEREAGDGSIEMDLAVEAQAEGTLMLTGARPGIDGTYRIVSVTHKASRSGGATTSLEVKQPGEGTGKDDRAPENVPAPTQRPAA